MREPLLKADTLLRYAEPEVVFRRGSLFFYSTFVAQLNQHNLLWIDRPGLTPAYGLRRADAGCELTEERSDAWEPHIANPEA